MITDEFYEWLLPLEKKIKVSFKRRELLVQAMTHKSYLHEHPDWPVHHNERFELLGDSVMELVVIENLLEIFPKRGEGTITQIKSALVKNNMIVTVAWNLGLDEFLKISKSTIISPFRDSMLSDVYEAVIGAIYLDRGLVAAQKFIKRTLLTRLKEVIDFNLHIDPKSKFQEKSQQLLGGVTPIYKVIGNLGNQTNPCFSVKAFIGGICVSEAIGPSIKAATIFAAEKALRDKAIEKLVEQNLHLLQGGSKS